MQGHCSTTPISVSRLALTVSCGSWSSPQTCTVLSLGVGCRDEHELWFHLPLVGPSLRNVPSPARGGACGHDGWAHILQGPEVSASRQNTAPAPVFWQRKARVS